MSNNVSNEFSLINILHKSELVTGYGVYVRFIHLEHAEQSRKPSTTGLIRSLFQNGTHRNGWLLVHFT